MGNSKTDTRNLSRNKFSNILHEDLKNGSINYPDPNTCHKIAAAAKETVLRKTEPEKSANEIVIDIKADLVRSLVTFAKVYTANGPTVLNKGEGTVGMDDSGEDISVHNIEHLRMWAMSMRKIGTERQLQAILQKYKNLLNSNNAKLAPMYFQRYSACFELSMISLKMYDLDHGQNRLTVFPYSRILSQFKASSNLYFNKSLTPNGTTLSKALCDNGYSNEINTFYQTLATCEYLHEYTSNRIILENPDDDCMANMIKKMFMNYATRFGEIPMDGSSSWSEIDVVTLLTNNHQLISDNCRIFIFNELILNLSKAVEILVSDNKFFHVLLTDEPLSE